jgi:hypothetical protein
MVMEDSSPSVQSAPPDPKKIEEERKKLDEDLEKGNITQAEYFKKVQDLTGSAATAPTPQQTPQPTQAQAPPQLPPATSPGIKPINPISPITPVSPQQAGPKEEIPPIGQALAVGSEDVEVVECYKCGGLITVTTPQRPVIIACPNCGTKGEVTAEDLAPVETTTGGAPKASEGVEIDENKIFKFGGESEKQTKGPQFGASLDADLAKQDKTDRKKATPTPQPKTETKE